MHRFSLNYFESIALETYIRKFYNDRREGLKEKDSISNKYMSDPERFADVFNYYVYDGEQVIKPENLHERDAAERFILKKYGKSKSIDKYRDVIKMCTVMADDNCTMVLLGIENQSEIHYAMPVRNMLYDAITYSNQVKTIAAKHRKDKDYYNSAEFLSGITQEDKLTPVITLVINWSDHKWDAPRSVSEMLYLTDSIIMRYVADYRINLIDPCDINEFDKFRTEIAEVLEIIKRQKEDDIIKSIKNRKGDDWEMSVESIEVINEFAGTNISTKSSEKGKVKMSKITQDLIDEGVGIGLEQGLDTGISGTVVILKGLGLDDATILDKITRQYNITEEKAKTFL